MGVEEGTRGVGGMEEGIGEDRSGSEGSEERGVKGRTDERDRRDQGGVEVGVGRGGRSSEGPRGERWGIRISPRLNGSTQEFLEDFTFLCILPRCGSGLLANEMFFSFARGPIQQRGKM